MAAAKSKKTKSDNQKPLIGPNTEIELVIEQKTAQAAYNSALKKLAKSVKKDGFRAGKVPLALAQQQLGTQRVIEEALNQIITPEYNRAIKEAGHTPVSQPQFTPVATELGKDWKITAAFASKPKVNLEGYQNIVKKALTDAKKERKKAAKQNKTDQSTKSAQQPEISEQEQLLTAVYRQLVTQLQPQIPELLLKQEVEYELQMLQYRLRSIGKTIDDYLASANLTYDDFSTNLTASTLGQLQLQYILQAIVEKEGLELSEAELKKAGKNSQNPQQSQQEMMRQKVVDFLLNLG